ncbi:MAG: hypothetical protein J6Z22_02175, partial [Lachnospiraceae bacterium]|nr:hypothetical protein [Lachnospiraceae bacterium]
MKRKVRRSLAGALAFVMAFTLVSSDVLAAGSHAMNPTQAPETVITEEPQEVETLEETEILENTEKTLSVTGMGFYTGFDEGTLSAGWTSGNSNPSYAFEIVGACDEITPYSSGYCAYLDSDLFDNANASLVSPVLSLRECYDTMMLSFWYQNRPGEYGNVDRIGIYYRLGEGTWVNIASITNATQ